MSKYDEIIEKVFFDNFKKGSKRVAFSRDELASASDSLGFPRIKNLGEKHLIDWYFKNKEKIEKNKTTLFTYSYNKMVDEVILELKELTQ